VKARGFVAANSQSMLQFDPSYRGSGASYMGFVWLDGYRLECWLYDGFFKHPQTGAATPYVSDDNVIMTSDGRLDLSFGSIPMIVRPDQRALPFLPPRITDGQRGIDLTLNAWITPNGENVIVSAGTRPLPSPTAIDTYARLDVTP